ncbi:MAG: indolepyruvate oxidoreductase subunit beta [Lachnospiraceae bacterium]|nr:indolepyruvate oxidoreductase subunit beta [Lachnospiraceae bacterium]
MGKTTNIVLCGVGGQGTVLASKLIAAASMKKGKKVMSAETIGMAQKGGSVFSHLRIGDDIKTAAIRRGTADIIIAFEPSEAVKLLPYLKEGGSVVVNSTAVMPVTAALKGSDYSGDKMIDYLKENVSDLLVIDGNAEALKLGNPKVLNVIMLGAAIKSGQLELTKEDIMDAIKAKVKPHLVEINEKALSVAWN